LQRPSYARPGKLFTANVSLFASTAGTVVEDRLNEIRNTLVSIIQGKWGGDGI